jgi:hypothetical protein
VDHFTGFLQGVQTRGKAGTLVLITYLLFCNYFLQRQAHTLFHWLAGVNVKILEILIIFCGIYVNFFSNSMICTFNFSSIHKIETLNQKRQYFRPIFFSAKIFPQNRNIGSGYLVKNNWLGFALTTNWRPGAGARWQPRAWPRLGPELDSPISASRSPTSAFGIAAEKLELCRDSFFLAFGSGLILMN